MSKTINIKSIEDTKLWKKLNSINDEVSQKLSISLKEICEEGSNRIKLMPAFATQYTLHDELHLLRVTELMGMILGSNLDNLNGIEIALLILSAYYHDQGMVIESNEYSQLSSDEDFILFQENWFVAHPNRKEIEKQLKIIELSQTEKNKLISMISELDLALLTDYLRTTHAKRGADYFHSEYSEDKRLEVSGHNISELTAKLCFSHHENALSLTPENGYFYDQQVGVYQVNMPYLAVILRLADILDFDRDRTPDVLFSSIHFTSQVSIREWEKHRGVYGWQITPDLIRFSMEFENPVYEATARQFLNWVDIELENCLELCSKFPANFSKYQLKLPRKVERSRIKSKNNSYIYHNLEFSLSRDEVVRLLMTEELYSNPSICIRELVQNSLDALRFRKSLFGLNKINWENGKIDLAHFIDENGYEIITCTDNGIGMDEAIVTKFLSKVGKSYYRSPEFERERVKLKKQNLDFDPCSQFGIGFMSCFMLGDRIIIETRKDYGNGVSYGKPLIIEINGLGSMFVIKEGQKDQEVGTKIKIISRKKPVIFDLWDDRVKLIKVLKGYALANEFPISGKCEIPEIKDKVLISNSIEKPDTYLEEYNLADNIIIIEENLNNIDPRLNGFVKESFIINEKGIPSLENDKLEWIFDKNARLKQWKVKNKESNTAIELYRNTVSVCIDGILVAGVPGKPSYKENLSSFLGEYNANLTHSHSVIVDVRGNIKPEITPSRRPSKDSMGFKKSLGWRRLNYLINMGEGKIAEKLSDFISKGLSNDDFWKLVLIYEMWLPNMSFLTIWEQVPISLIDENDKIIEWKKISELQNIRFNSSNTLSLSSDGKLISASDQLLKIEKDLKNKQEKLNWMMNILVLLMSSIRIENNEIKLSINYPATINDCMRKYTIFGSMGTNAFQLNYDGIASDAFSVGTSFPTANKNHIFCKKYIDKIYVSNKTELEEFIDTFVINIPQIISSKNAKEVLNKPSSFLKRLAYKYYSINWDAYDNSLKPPYKVWTTEDGWINIDETYFSKWKDFEVKDD